jgi:succinate-semialdehyde dehydrogenase/glutarate-semialdehyde dehydrogenase
MIETTNPATGAHLATYGSHGSDEVDRTLASARAAFAAWRTTTFEHRAAALLRVAAHLRARKHEIAQIASLEMGKPIVEAEAEVEKCASGCTYYAEQGERILTAEQVPSSATRSYVAYRPLGAVLAIMPWNYPYWQVFRFAAPTLMAGNVGVLKHAANVTGCALEIERIFQQCGFPDGVFSTILVSGRDMDAVIADERIAAVTLTGSEAAGSAVAAQAGRYLKKTVLELGGSDAFIVLADADLEAAARIGVRARFQNNGQSCIAAKRFIVQTPVYDAFCEAFVRHARALRIGDPLERSTELGPLARPDLRDDIERQIHESIAMGARALLGAKRIEGPGAYYEPTILADVTRAMPVFTEETFGPAAALIRANDEAHAVDLANASPYGLGGNVWTRDIARGEAIAAQIETGAVFINGMTASDPRLPFGGVKLSGYGRELSDIGMREFVNVQTVWIGPQT